MNHKFSVAAFAVTLGIVLGTNQLLSVERPAHDQSPNQCHATDSRSGASS